MCIGIMEMCAICALIVFACCSLGGGIREAGAAGGNQFGVVTRVTVGGEGGGHGAALRSRILTADEDLSAGAQCPERDWWG